jgi:RND family efflux transporter MFP subunit
MKKRKIIIPIVCAAVLAAGAVLVIRAQSAVNASGGTFLQTEAVAMQDLQNYITASGTIESGDITKVYSSLVYPVLSVNVEVGDMVKKGDLLCTIDTEELEQKISEQEASIASTDQNTEYTISDAEKAYNDAVTAYETGENTQIINAQNSLDNAKTALETAQKNYDDALATQGTDKDTQLRSAKMSVDNAKKSIETAKEAVADAEEALKKALDNQKNEDYYSIKNVTENYDEAKENYEKSRSTKGSQDITAAYGEYESALRTYLEWSYGYNNGNLSEYEIQSATQKAQQAISAAEQKITELEAKYDITDANDNFKEATESYVKAKEQIDDQNQTAVDNAEKAVESAKRQVESAETQLESAQMQLESVEDGNTKGLDNYKEQLENAQISYNKAKRSYDLTVKSVEDNIASLATQADRAKNRNSNNSAMVNLQNLKDQLAEATITAPCDGMITYENVAEGIEPSPTAVLFTIEDPDDLIIDVSISEYDMPSVSTDMKCEIVPNAMTELTYDGVIRSIDPTAAKNASGDDAGSASFKATIAVTSVDTKMLIGMTARVNIITEEEKNALTVSSDLVSNDPQGSYVFAAVKDGDIYKAKKIYVNTDMETSFYVAVTPVNPGELTEGTLLLTNTVGITDGQTVSVREQGTGGNFSGGDFSGDDFAAMGGYPGGMGGGPGGMPPVM